MAGGWFESDAPPFRRLRGRVDGVAWSPDGRHLAFWQAREADTDLRVRERVVCVEVATGREVFALDGPAVVRALAFTATDVLCTVRDGASGSVRVGAHAVPDGGELFARTLPDLGGTALTVLAGDGAMLVAPRSYGYTRGPESAYVLGPALEVRAMVRPRENPWRVVDEIFRRVTLALQPDGAEIALLYGAVTERFATVPGALVRVPLGDGPTVRLPAVLRGWDATAWWPGPSTLLAACAGASGAQVVLLDAVGATVRFDTHAGVDIEAMPRWPGRTCTVDMHPSRDRVLLCGDGGDGKSPVRVLDVATGGCTLVPDARTVRGAGSVVAAAWLGPGDAWMQVTATEGGVAVAVCDTLVATPRVTRGVPITGGREWLPARIERVPGGRDVVLSWREGGATRLALAAVTALRP